MCHDHQNYRCQSYQQFNEEFTTITSTIIIGRAAVVVVVRVVTVVVVVVVVVVLVVAGVVVVIPVGREFSAPVQIGPGAHPASCTMGTWSLPGVKYGRGVLLSTHVPWSWKSRAIPLPTLWATPGL
jgi:hypothetical protein